jgi:1-aminocyclopropane-1-carboxylate synthase
MQIRLPTTYPDSNPIHRIIGRCYTRKTLTSLLRFCRSKGMHLISDEIYALSVYERDDRRSETFVSVLSINLDGLIGPGNVHVLCGMSKVLSDGAVIQLWRC